MLLSLVSTWTRDLIFSGVSEACWIRKVEPTEAYSLEKWQHRQRKVRRMTMFQKYSAFSVVLRRHRTDFHRSEVRLASWRMAFLLRKHLAPTLPFSLLCRTSCRRDLNRIPVNVIQPPAGLENGSKATKLEGCLLWRMLQESSPFLLPEKHKRTSG